MHAVGIQEKQVLRQERGEKDGGKDFKFISEGRP